MAKKSGRYNSIIKRIIGSYGLHILITLAFIAFYLFLTLKYKPEPISDFKYYYWEFVKNPINIPYIKGGILFILYFPFKWMEPWLAAFFVNSILYLFASSVFYCKTYDTKKHFFSKIIFVMVSFWLGGLMPIVNSDLPHLFFLVIFLNQIKLKKYNTWKEKLILGSLLFAAVTIRSQILPILIFVTAVLFLIGGKYRKFVKASILTIVISIILSFVLNAILINKQQGEIAADLTYRRTLYHGLLVSNTDVTCGEWTQNGLDLVIAEQNLPFMQILTTHLKEKGFIGVADVIFCKIDKIINFNQFTYYWLNNHLKENSDLMRLLMKIEAVDTDILKLIAVFLIGMPFISSRIKIKSSIFYILILSTLIGYLAFHIIFEIQARYFIPFYGAIFFGLFPYILEKYASKKNN